MRLGAHVSTAGGVDKAIDRAQEMGAETIQIFGSSPQSWGFKPVLPAQADSFRQKALAAGVHPVFLHGIYLINLGSPIAENVSKGVASLIAHMKLADQIGASGVIFHPGSHKGAGYEGILQQTVAAIQEVLEATPPNVWLVLENMAGMGQHIGAKFVELGGILRAVGSPRLKICLDTEHCYAAGYDVAHKDGLEKALEEFDRDIGLERLVAVHANDAKVPLGAGVDRHENIGQGHMGIEGFETIMGHPAFKDVPFFLEVPGMEGQGPDRANLDVLKAIREKLGIKA